MARDNTNDFYAALAVGTLLGVGAALLLRPSPRSARERLLREIRPYRRQLRHSAEEARRALVASAHAAGELAGGDLTEDAVEVGRELLAEFREEVRRILEEARQELASIADEEDDERGTAAGRRARWELEERLERRLGRRRMVTDRRYGEDEDAETEGEDEES
jgi:gas vesicle protein